ncbi:odorant receptor 30a-like [Phymastichus coffea]|uniref:odorant receptor 30a-like n=1 Tax=Phymastichus coffea TaxID=108790 RepID=UPI00273CC6CA|nr:odorant receptor 30a-like [Phymastichus coffea]
MCAFDSMYVVCVQHCLGLFAIIKFRLRKSTESYSDQTLSKVEKEAVTYKYITKTIELHKNVLIFTAILEATYSSTFLILVGLNMLIISLACVLILIKIDDNDIMSVLRFSFVLIGSVLHLFFLSWPGQALTDYSLSLSDDAYANEWYEASIESQRSLKFLILRCIKPCQLTAGGIYVMNFSNFAMIIKTSVSYITMFISLT